MLCEVLATCCSGSNTRSDCRPEGMFCRSALYSISMLILPSLQRPEQNETSLAIVPRTHPVLKISHLEAEASGLLDRLLGVFQEDIWYGNITLGNY